MPKNVYSLSLIVCKHINYQYKLKIIYFNLPYLALS